jgi:hypothetical protein
MKLKKFAKLRPGALIAIGVCLGRGAQADTVIDFNTAPGPVNATVDQALGDYVTASSDGVTVTGFGTPNIGLTWSAVGEGDTGWEYYNDSVWSAIQLNDSTVGSSHRLTFTPNSASARVVVKSFSFHPYYNSTERFSYNVSVLAGTNLLSGPTLVSFLSNAAKHPVSINATGAIGQTLKLRISRVASTLGASEVEGDPYDIAVDDITFAQLPASVLPIGPQVVSVTPADDATGVAANSYSYLASITNGATTPVASSIKLKLDGVLVSPPATVTSVGDLTNVSYTASSLLASGSTHVYTLTYADNLAVNYTNETVFTVISYAVLPGAYALPPGSGIVPGFTYRSVAVNQDTTNVLASSVARAKAQLAGTLIDVSTGAPFTNTASLGTNADGSFSQDTVLNFSDFATSQGDFPDDLQFPGLEAGPYDWFSTEALLYLDLPAGYYRLGVNSDDGFEFNALAPQGVPGAPIRLGIFDNGRGASDTLFDFLVQTSGVYSFQLIYFENQGSASCELFSVSLPAGTKTLVNDPATLSAIKSYRVLRPHLTRIARSGSNAVIDWAYGTPPFQLQFKNNLTNAVWTDVGGPTSARTATTPLLPGNGFFRVYGK